MRNAFSHDHLPPNAREEGYVGAVNDRLVLVPEAAQSLKAGIDKQFPGLIPVSIVDFDVSYSQALAVQHAQEAVQQALEGGVNV